MHSYYDFSNAEDNEWLVDNIVTHQWNGNKVSFLIQWNLGDTTWEPYSECKDLEALDRYLELLGIDDDDWWKQPRKALAVKECLSNLLGEMPKEDESASIDMPGSYATVVYPNGECHCMTT